MISQQSAIRLDRLLNSPKNQIFFSFLMVGVGLGRGIEEKKGALVVLILYLVVQEQLK